MQSQVRVQQGSGEGSGEGPEKVPEKVWEASVQSQVRFNRVPEKVWEAWVQSQVRSNRICGDLIHGSPAGVFPALGLASRFRKTCKNKTLRLFLSPQRGGAPNPCVLVLRESYFG